MHNAQTANNGDGRSVQFFLYPNIFKGFLQFDDTFEDLSLGEAN